MYIEEKLNHMEQLLSQLVQKKEDRQGIDFPDFLNFLELTSDQISNIIGVSRNEVLRKFRNGVIPGAYQIGEGTRIIYRIKFNVFMDWYNKHPQYSNNQKIKVIDINNTRERSK